MTTTHDEATLVDAVKRIIAAATVAASRHPRCGAFAWLNATIRDLPPHLRVQVGRVGEHPEDDHDDALAEIRRLTRENEALRRRLAEAEGRQLSLLESIGAADVRP